MGGGTFGFVVFSVLSVDLLAAFLIDRWQIGTLVSATALAGTATCLRGIKGVAGRIWWGHMTEERWNARHALIVISIGNMFVPVSMLLAPRWPSLIWIASRLGGITFSSWKSVGMLAIVQRLGHEYPGQGSGVVLLGFLTGLGTGAPLFGFSVDVLESYRPGWITVAVVFALGLGLMLRGEIALPGDIAA